MTVKIWNFGYKFVQNDKSITHFYKIFIIVCASEVKTTEKCIVGYSFLIVSKCLKQKCDRLNVQRYIKMCQPAYKGKGKGAYLS